MTSLFELYCYFIMCHRLGDAGDSFIIAVNDSIIDGYSHRLINGDDNDDDTNEAIEAYSRILMIDCVASMVYSCIIIIIIMVIIILLLF